MSICVFIVSFICVISISIEDCAIILLLLVHVYRIKVTNMYLTFISAMRHAKPPTMDGLDVLLTVSISFLC